jgi:DNA-binding LacI/PurR family transcriptional regulator
MAELGYVPSERRPGPKPHARAQSVSKNVALLKFSYRRGNTPGLEELLRGVSEAARRHNITLTLYDLPHADDIPRKIVDHPTSGVLLHGAAPTEQIHKMLHHIPTVWLMGNRVRPEWGDQVMPDTAQIGRLAAQYLVSRGHKNVAFLNLDWGHWPFRHYGMAFMGMAEELGVSGRIVRLPGLPRHTGFHFEPDEIQTLADTFAAINPRPTGIFYADDIQAALLQPALIQRGVKFGPEGAGGVEAVSCNKEEPFLMGLFPRPASIDIRVESIGRKGLDQLLWRASHPEFPDRIVTLIEPRLVAPDGKVVEFQDAAPTPASQNGDH